MDIVAALLEDELCENANLIEVLSVVRSAKASPKDARVAALVRGLCTKNTELLSLLRECTLEQEGLEGFKLFATGFVRWFEQAIVVFRNYFACFPLDYDHEVVARPLLHLRCYATYIGATSALLRNPFIVEKLSHFRAEIDALLSDYAAHVETQHLNNISFENILAFGGTKVSSHFTPAQIVERTQNEPFVLHSRNVELLLLNLGSSEPYNAMAILSVAPNQPRSLLYPPFRVNDLLLSLGDHQLCFATVLLANKAPRRKMNITVANAAFLRSWYAKLAVIFPTSSEKLVSSLSIQLAGLGINTVSSTDEESSVAEGLSAPSPNYSRRDSAGSCSSAKSSTSERSTCSKKSVELMHKQLSSAGIGSSKTVSHTPQVSVLPEAPLSVKTQFGYQEPEDASDNDSMLCFEMVPKPYSSKQAAASMPNLSEKSKVYTNAAGSAIDVSNFGRNHNPFEAAPKKTLRFMKLFKKEPRQKDKNTKQLTIEPPKAVGDTKEPSSATSSNFSRTLPLPFALPSSTSMYFFKPYADANNSTASLDQSAPLDIPQCLKDTINSDETEDVYILPLSPNSLKVSKWKASYGKWEMLTASDSVFCKISTNFELQKSWLLVFEEAYEEKYKEVIDRPLLILDINHKTEARQSLALDLEISTVNSITSAPMRIIMRCNNGALLNSLKGNLETTISAAIGKPSMLKSSSAFSSNNTLSSSLMSKPSTSSTLTSIATLNRDGEKALSVLLERMTVRLHRQLKGYEAIHELSSWETIAMFTLSVFHSAENAFHLKLENQELNDAHFLWIIPDNETGRKVERIGKAGMLVKIDAGIFMMECKGKREAKRLSELF